MSFKKLDKEKTQLYISVLTNLFTIISGLVLGFFLPKFVSIETYSRYKTYTLYVEYLGIFHFGFINGLYLIYGGLNYDELPKNRFYRYSIFLFLSQFIIQSLLILIIVFVGKTNFVSPLLFVALNVFLVNANAYFMLVDQFSKRFFVDAMIQLAQCILTLILFSILLLIHNDNYLTYLVSLLLINVIVFLFHLYNSRELIFNCPHDYELKFSEIKKIISRGIFVLLSEYLGIIILGIDSIFVNLFMPKKDFSIYSFAISVIAVFYSLTGMISKFIFPYLKRISPEKYPFLYPWMKGCLSVFSAFVCGLTIIVIKLIPIVLPKYFDSIFVLKILGITTVFKGLQLLLCGNFFKILDFEKGFITTNACAFILGVLTDLIALLLFGSLQSIAVASLISYLLWFAFSDLVLRKKMTVEHSGNIGIFIILVVYFISIYFDDMIGLVFYYVIILILLTKVCFEFKRIKTLFN